MSRQRDRKFSKSFDALQDEIERLKPDEREKVEKAKKILIKAKGLEGMDAYRLLMAHSLELNKKLVESAEAVIFGYKVFGKGDLKGKNTKPPAEPEK